MGKTPAQPVAPRPAGSSARQEEMAKLQKFQAAPAKLAVTPKTASRTPAQDLSAIEPPPQGLANPPSIVETPEPKTTEAPSQSLSPQSEALARREIQLRKAQQKLKADQVAWEQEQAKYIPKDKLSSDTLKVLAEAGITADKLVELQINQATSQDPQQVLLNRIADLESKLNGITDPENGTLAQRDKAAYEQVLKQIGSDAKLLVDSDPAFGTIRSEGKTNDVVELITSIFEAEGEILDVEEAAKLVEDKLVENLSQQYERLSKYDKIQAKLRKPAENLEEATLPQQSAQPHKSQVTTLTNTGSSQKPLTPYQRAVLQAQAAIDRNKGR